MLESANLEAENRSYEVGLAREAAAKLVAVAGSYCRTMRLNIDSAGRLVLPSALLDVLGLGDGGMVDVSLYGQGLYIVPNGRTARLVPTERGLVAESETAVTDETILGLVDVLRR